MALPRAWEHRRFWEEFISVREKDHSQTFNNLFSRFLAQLEIEKHYFATSLSVLEDQPMDMLLGLDMLRRHQVRLSSLSFTVHRSPFFQCVLDLDKNVLRIANSVETSFLPESELPSHARLTGNAEEMDESEWRPPASAGTASSSVNFPEESIKHITKSGFTREQAIEELKSSNGDATKALVSLMARSLAIPKRKR